MQDGNRNVFVSKCVEWVRTHKGFLLILLLATVLRFAWLGTIPIGLSWDEAAIGYNGYGIAVVRRDEWLNKLPVSFKSFGDFKAAAAIYTNAATSMVFGSSAFSIRFPMAVAGVATVIAAYGIALQYFHGEKKKQIALFAMLLVAVSPLNIHYSRIGFESAMGVAASAFAIWTLLLVQKKAWFLVLSAAFAALALYSYHSPKISLPLLLLVFILGMRHEMRKHLQWVVAAIIVGVLLIFPLAKDTFQGNGGERFYMTSVIADRHGLLPMAQLSSHIIENFQKHLSPNFLLFGETTTYRHGNNAFGVLGWVEAMGVVAAILFTVKTKQKREGLLLLLSIIIGLLPAVMSNDAPHSNRAHGIVPWVQLFSAYGIVCLINSFSQHYRKLFMLFTFVFILIETFWHGTQYISVFTSKRAGTEFQFGAFEAARIARSYESQVDRVIMTDSLGQPYIYVLYAKRLTPIQWQQGALSNYEFRKIRWDEDGKRSKTLLVGTGEEIPSDVNGIVEEIRYPNGDVAIRIVRVL